MIGFLIVELVAFAIVSGLAFKVGRRLGKRIGRREGRKRTRSKELAEDPVARVLEVASFLTERAGGEKLGPWIVSREGPPSRTPKIVYAEDLAEGLERFASDLHDSEAWARADNEPVEGVR